jgi:peroxiredoxin
MELQNRLDELRKNDIGLAVISYDSQQTLTDFSRRQRITYPLSSDVGSDDQALRDPEQRRRRGAWTEREGSGGARRSAAICDRDAGIRTVAIPFPGTCMVDRRARVTARFFEDYYRERNSSDTWG